MSIASALTYTFEPDPIDLWDLYHGQYYTWGINWVKQPNKTIMSASLSIENINNWAIEDDDILYIHLLDNPSSGANRHYDSLGGDQFAGQGILLTSYIDDNEVEGKNPSEDWTYAFTIDELGILDNYLDGNSGYQYTYRKLIVFLVVTKNHISPGMTPGFFYRNTEGRFF